MRANVRVRRVACVASRIVEALLPFVRRGALACLLAIADKGSAASYYWNAQLGDWSVAENWGGTRPDSSANACITNGGTATISLPEAACSVLYLGLSTGSGTVQMTAGSLNVSLSSYIGYSNSGNFTHSGGTHSIAGNLFLGYNSGVTGTYTLSGTGQLSVSEYEYIGYNGSGVFNQTGGTNTVSKNLFLGRESGNGTYTLSGGALTAGINEYVGYTGTGTFTQNGGTNSVTNYLYLGATTGAMGTYNLNGGTLSVQQVTSVTGGTSTFNFNGGLLKANSNTTSSAGLLSTSLDYVTSWVAGPTSIPTGCISESAWRCWMAAGEAD